jgi:hypothetical protein
MKYFKLYLHLLILKCLHIQIKSDKPTLFTFDIGRTSRLTSNAWSINNVKVSKVIIHPSYNGDTSKGNDIALMKLAVNI